MTAHRPYSNKSIHCVILLLHHLKSTCIFFATNHVKGALDGVEGTIKRVVYRGLIAEKWIPSPIDDKSFAECTNSVCNDIELIFCSKEAVERDINAFEECVFDINNIPNLRHSLCES